MSLIDDNREYVSMAVTDNASATPTPIKIDPITGRLEVMVYAYTSTPTANTSIPTDSNRLGVAEAVTSTTGEIRPLLTDTNGYLLVDLTIE